ncbi:VOC family protein [Paracoccus sp. S1E-3]|uniref:VOC family protein n=1 Tax=Paracoccus sp. S1E-3 TaxID=2756130 RepID=UPI0015EF93B5|nr:VOC family protein [Paracoccus sp. S1E-3]MBA4491326.1 lactoylglutathione lyase [Paracoccus sp. S1E-3]
MPRMIFVNLPVADLAAASRFYTAIGCQKNDQFSDENAASMVWSDTITFQLLTRAYFQTFTSMPLADASKACAAMYALSMDSRADIDATTEAGAAAGGTPDGRPVMDMGWMYNRQLQDPDGHVLELVWMDMKAMEEQGAA